MSEKDVLLQMKDIVKVFGKNVIINHISLDIERGCLLYTSRCV